VLVADHDLRDLSAFRPNQHVKAASGGAGGGALKHGASGAAAELHVPVGTQVLDDEGRLLADLAHAGARTVAARGGLPGRGNKRFATPTRQAPRFAETGLPGDELWLELRLKLLADAALVGFPNAGKSSLLRRISNAKPKVADYPFTTLAPVLGTVDGTDGRQLTVADVPGLIEGASEGVGLGHEFLAHLERARLLVHVIDATEDAPERFAAINLELERYGAGLESLPQVIALNKIDLLSESPTFEVDDPRIVAKYELSAATGAGIAPFRHGLFEHVPPVAEPAQGEPGLVDFLVYRPRPRRERGYRILRTDRGFRVEGTAPDEAELERALRAAGARKGAEVEVGEETFELA
jgi:GTP-binding protein